MDKEYRTTLPQLLEDLAAGKKLHNLVEWKRFIKPDNTVFIVVDIQNDVVHPEGNLNWTGTWKIAKEMNLVENVKGIVAACRQKQIPVIWVRQTFLAEGRDLIPGSYFEALVSYMRTAIPDLMFEDTWEIDVVDELKAVMEPQDLHIDKRLWNTFEGTNLQTYLNMMGTKNIICCGTMIDQCVEATLRTGWDRGYLPVLVTDASAGNTEEIVKMTCERLGFFMAALIDSAGLVELINSL